MERRITRTYDRLMSKIAELRPVLIRRDAAGTIGLARGGGRAYAA